MENVQFFVGTLEFANLFISIFILYFAFLFLRKSFRHKDRRPWELLIASTVVFFVSEILAFAKIVYSWEIIGLRSLLQTLWAALVLFAFTHQHHLIHNQDEIRINRKKADIPPR